MSIKNQFVVVMKPEFSERNYHPLTPVKHGKIYRGVERRYWEISGELDDVRREEAKYVVKQIEKSELSSVYGITVSDYKNALRFIDLCGDKGEILYIEDNLSIITRDNSRFIWLGFECLVENEWSLNRESFFIKPKECPFIKIMNKNALFKNVANCNEFIEWYIINSRIYNYEPISENGSIVIINVFSVSHI